MERFFPKPPNTTKNIASFKSTALMPSAGWIESVVDPSLLLSLSSPERSSPEDQPFDRIASTTKASSRAHVSMTRAIEDEGQSHSPAIEISASQRMLSAITGSVLTSLLGKARSMCISHV